MRIISKYHDYYDTAMALGQDQSLVWQRKRLPLAGHIKNLPEQLQFLVPTSQEQIEQSLYYGAYTTPNKSKIAITPITVAVGGKLYFAARCSQQFGMNPFENVFFYTYAALAQWATKQGPEILAVITKADHRPWMSPSPNWEQLLSNQGDDTHSKQLAALGHPIVICNPRSPTSVVADGSLKEVMFQKMLDVYTVYQELSMWLASYRTDPSQPPLEISDELRAQQHGFDCKSFRKDATKHKPKSCKTKS